MLTFDNVPASLKSKYLDAQRLIAEGKLAIAKGRSMLLELSLERVCHEQDCLVKSRLKRVRKP